MKQFVDFWDANMLIEQADALLYIGKIVRKSRKRKRVDKRIYRRLYRGTHNLFDRLRIDCFCLVKGKRPIYRKRSRILRVEISKGLDYQVRCGNFAGDEVGILVRDYLKTFIPIEELHTWHVYPSGRYSEAWGERMLQRMRDAT